MKTKSTEVNKQIDPKLNSEETDNLSSLARNTLRNIDDMESEIQKLSKIFIESAKKTKNINIRIAETDLLKIKSMANENGLPYQTLIAIILRQYVSGRLQVHL